MNGKQVYVVAPLASTSGLTGYQRCRAIMEGVVASGVKVELFAYATGGSRFDGGGFGPSVRSIEVVSPAGERTPWRRASVGLVLRCGFSEPDVSLFFKAIDGVAGTPDALVVSGAPWSAVMAASRYAVDRGVPYVLDFRDEWSRNPVLRSRLGPLWASSARKAEARSVELAAYVTAPEAYILDELRGVSSEKKIHVPHGCSPNVVTSVSEPRILPTESPVHIVFAGTRDRALNEDIFVRDLYRLKGQLSFGVDLELVGSDRPSVVCGDDWLKITVRPRVSHGDLMAVYSGADCLLWHLPPTRGLGVAGSKVEECKATGRPILAYCEPNSRLFRVALETPGAWPVGIGDLDGLAAALSGIRQSAMVGRDFRERRSIRPWSKVAEEIGALVSGIML